MNPLASLSSLAVIIFPGKREEPPSPHAPDQSGGKTFHLPASEQFRRKGNPADIHRTHQGTADGNSLRFSFEGRPTDIHRTHQGKADGNTPSPGTAGESQLTTDKQTTI